LNEKSKKTHITQITVIIILFGVFSCMFSITNVYSACTTNANCDNEYAYPSGSSSIIISRDNFSPSAMVHIVIHAPDFNSNPYAIDRIGEDENKVVISTRESSLPYLLVETGPDTGDFAGYVILSSTTSQCSPVCGPTDGFLAAGGDDAITVSFTYSQGHTVSSTSYGIAQSNSSHKTIPEFQFVDLVLLVGVVSIIFFSKMKRM
jgi:hypothetical protein